jgi:hypothetical protein
MARDHGRPNRAARRRTQWLATGAGCPVDNRRSTSSLMRTSEVVISTAGVVRQTNTRRTKDAKRGTSDDLNRRLRRPL